MSVKPSRPPWQVAVVAVKTSEAPFTLKRFQPHSRMRDQLGISLAMPRGSSGSSTFVLVIGSEPSAVTGSDKRAYSVVFPIIAFGSLLVGLVEPQPENG